MTQCPRCGGHVAAGQEYCLECGIRLAAAERFAPVPPDRRSRAVPLAIAAAVAVAGAALAIGLTRDTVARTAILTATGGSEVVSEPSVEPASGLAQWPAGTSGWTNILVSVPKVDGREAAVAFADQGREKGLRRVGVLDSSRYPSLHPGYWVVFVGVYTSEPEAAGRLREVKAVQKGARTERVTP